MTGGWFRLQEPIRQGGNSGLVLLDVSQTPCRVREQDAYQNWHPRGGRFAGP